MDFIFGSTPTGDTEILFMKSEIHRLEGLNMEMGEKHSLLQVKVARAYDERKEMCDIAGHSEALRKNQFVQAASPPRQSPGRV